MASQYLPIPLMEGIRSGQKKFCTSWKWFSNVNTMILYSKYNVCNESKGIQNRGLQITAIAYGPPIFAFSNHERNTKWPKGKYVQIGNCFPM